MTPMINELVRLAKRKGPIWDKSSSGIDTPRDLVKRLGDAKTFFIPDASEDFARLCEQHPVYTSESAGVFLPAPEVWIECGPMKGSDLDRAFRSAFLLRDDGDAIRGLLIMLMPNGRLVVVDTFVLRLALSGGDSSVEFSGWLPAEETESIGTRLELALLLINMPVGLKVVDRPAHKANSRAFEQISGARPAVSYRTVNLDPWAEAEKSGAGVSTGSRRAFHFCRAHTRTRRTGRTEAVRAHWRGDDNLGRVEKRYFVGPSQGGHA